VRGIDAELALHCSWSSHLERRFSSRHFALNGRQNQMRSPWMQACYC
jgi:hypothetical protein